MPIKTYYQNHIVTTSVRSFMTDNGRRTEWDCSLCGEFVGQIDLRSGKPYKSLVQYEGEPYRFKHVGYYASLTEAKRALLGPARDYLNA